MKYYEVKVYLTDKKRSICTMLFESKSSLDSFADMLNSELNTIMIGDIIFNRKDFKYATIKEKELRK